MYVSDSKIKKAIHVFEEHDGVMRTSEVLNEGIHQRTLYAMRDRGVVNMLERGLYRLANKESMSNPDLLIVAKKIPHARLCLISALYLHNLTDEVPHVVHIALARSAWEPQMEHPPIKTYRFSEESYQAGVEIYRFDGVEIGVYNPAKTIADCFKFRNKIGIDVAVKALKEGVSEGKASYKDITHYARICGVSRVMQPYMEVLSIG